MIKYQPKMDESTKMALKAMQQGVDKALAEHKRLGVPAVYMKDGKMVYLLPDGREVTELPPEFQKSKRS